jgi:hypothetical protein
MSGERNSDGGEVRTAAVCLRVIGFPGSFTAWGLECVRQILESAGYSSQVTPSDQSPDDAGDTSVAVRVLFGHGPVVTQSSTAPTRTIVCLDTPVRPFHELLASGRDAADAARVLTGTLASLGSILREDGVLLIRRTIEMDPVATQSAIARHISGILTLPGEPAPTCPPIDTSAAPPSLAGQALTLLRQTVIPLADFVTGRARDAIVWPLACFYSGDYPNELASSFIEVVGRARMLYYGPYFHLPLGRWRADVQIIVSGNLHDKKLAVDVFCGVVLARHQFTPAQGGLLQASLPFIVERTEDRIEVRVELLEGAIEGYLGLKQVFLHPVET